MCTPCSFVMPLQYNLCMNNVDIIGASIYGIGMNIRRMKSFRRDDTTLLGVYEGGVQPRVLKEQHIKTTRVRTTSCTLA